jgi:hypothetical protein
MLLLTLTLLLAVYTLFGMFLAEFPIVWLGWMIAISGVFWETKILTFPKLGIERLASSGLRPDIGSFILLVGAATIVPVILFWLHIFLKIVAIFTAEFLVRLELRHTNFSVAKSFWILTITPLTGLGLGWLASSFI